MGTEATKEKTGPKAEGATKKAAATPTDVAAHASTATANGATTAGAIAEEVGTPHPAVAAARHQRGDEVTLNLGKEHQIPAAVTGVSVGAGGEKYEVEVRYAEAEGPDAGTVTLSVPGALLAAGHPALKQTLTAPKQDK